MVEFELMGSETNRSFFELHSINFFTSSFLMTTCHAPFLKTDPISKTTTNIHNIIDSSFCKASELLQMKLDDEVNTNDNQHNDEDCLMDFKEDDSALLQIPFLPNPNNQNYVTSKLHNKLQKKLHKDVRPHHQNINPGNVNKNHNSNNQQRIPVPPIIPYLNPHKSQTLPQINARMKKALAICEQSPSDQSERQLDLKGE